MDYNIIEKIGELDENSPMETVIPLLFYDYKKLVKPSQKKWKKFGRRGKGLSFSQLAYQEPVSQTDIENLKNWLRFRILIQSACFEDDYSPILIFEKYKDELSLGAAAQLPEEEINRIDDDKVYINPIFDLPKIYFAFLENVIKKLGDKNHLNNFNRPWFNRITDYFTGRDMFRDLERDIYFLQTISSIRDDSMAELGDLWERICHLAFLNETTGNYILVPLNHLHKKENWSWNMNFYESQLITPVHQKHSQMVVQKQLTQKSSGAEFNAEHWTKDIDGLIRLIVCRNYVLMEKVNPKLSTNQGYKEAYDKVFKKI